MLTELKPKAVLSYPASASEQVPVLGIVKRVDGDMVVLDQPPLKTAVTMETRRLLTGMDPITGQSYPVSIVGEIGVGLTRKTVRQFNENALKESQRTAANTGEGI